MALIVTQERENMARIDNEGKIHRRVSRTTVPLSKPSFHTRKRVYCSDRSYVIAGVLALEFGFLGVHNFYAKYNKKGIIQLCITISAGIFLFNMPIIFVIIFFGMWTWGIVEGILFLIGKVNKDGTSNDFWRDYFSQLTSVEYIRPYSYPHKKAWVITAIVTLIYFSMFFILPISNLVNSISMIMSSSNITNIMKGEIIGHGW